jgi:hypothetical protein
VCDPRALSQAITHKYPNLDPATAHQEVDHLLGMFGCGPPAPAPSSFAATSGPDMRAPQVPQLATRSSLEDEVRLEPINGIFAVPVIINESVKIPFVLDSGAADVQIPADVVSTLVRTGTLSEADFTGEGIYVFANGGRLRSPHFNIREIRIGERVVRNVPASVGLADSPSALLGQSFLSRFPSWTRQQASCPDPDAINGSALSWECFDHVALKP